MDKVDIINNSVKFFFICIYLYLVYSKIINYKENSILKKIIIILSSMFISILYIILIQYVQPIFSMLITCFTYSIILMSIVKNKFYYSIVVFIIAFVITYMTYLVSVLISGILIMILIPNTNPNSHISLIIIPLVNYILLYLLSRIKRFKNGFNFLKNVKIMKKIGGITVLFGSISILIFCLLQSPKDVVEYTYILVVTILITISLFIWIQSQITLRYKENMKDRTIELQNEEIEKQSKEIEELKQENFKISSVVHQYNHRLSALEQAIVNKLNNNMQIESSSELAIMLDEVKNMSKEFAKEVEIPINNPLPKTNIMEIDHMFQYMEAKAKENNIQFELIINHSIHYLTENIITKKELETLIGDHISDAIIAINANHTDKRKIMCILGKIEDYYELCIYDTGINFEIETLINLGRKRITTHKEEGGSGIGFMTSFETLRKCKGSLIIDEYCSKDAYYTKSISFRFDGKNEYKIHSPRAEEIKEKDKENRIIEK